MLDKQSARSVLSIEACVPLKERLKNAVDELLGRIKKIQKQCAHDFRFFELPILEESQVPGVFVIYRADRSPLTEPKKIVLQCLYCSEQKVWKPLDVCFKCLYDGKFEESSLHRREIYFGEKYIYYGVRLHRCPKCGLNMVADEWNQ